MQFSRMLFGVNPADLHDRLERQRRAWQIKLDSVQADLERLRSDRAELERRRDELRSEARGYEMASLKLLLELEAFNSAGQMRREALESEHKIQAARQEESLARLRAKLDECRARRRLLQSELEQLLVPYGEEPPSEPDSDTTDEKDARKHGG